MRLLARTQRTAGALQLPDSTSQDVIKPLIELGRVQLQGRKAVADNPQGHQALAEVITPTQEQYEATWGPDSMTMLARLHQCPYISGAVERRKVKRFV